MLTAHPALADLSALLALSDRSELRVRSPGSTASTAASVDLETAPQARLTLASSRLRNALIYSPRLTLWGVGDAGSRLVLLHGGGVRLEFLGPRVRLSLDEAASYGGVNLATAAPAPGPGGAPPRVDAVPALQVVDFVSSSTTLASALSWRRWASSLSVGYQVGGGATAAARGVIPLQKGPSGEVSVARAVTRDDFISTKISASEASFSSGPESLLVEQLGGWRHRWSRADETRIEAGVSEARARVSAVAPHTLGVFPVAEAVAERRSTPGAGRVDLRLGLRLGPVVNRLVGLVDQRAQGTLAVSRTRGRSGAHAYASAARSVGASGAASIRLLSGELGASYGASESLNFDAGVRGLWQRQGVHLPDLMQATVFVGVSLRAPTTRL